MYCTYLNLEKKIKNREIKFVDMFHIVMTDV